MVDNKIFDEDYGKSRYNKFKQKCWDMLNPDIKHYDNPALSLFDAYKQLKLVI